MSKHQRVTLEIEVFHLRRIEDALRWTIEEMEDDGKHRQAGSFRQTWEEIMDAIERAETERES